MRHQLATLGEISGGLHDATASPQQQRHQDNVVGQDACPSIGRAVLLHRSGGRRRVDVHVHNYLLYSYISGFVRVCFWRVVFCVHC